MGYSPWGRKELDTTEQLNTHIHTHTHTHTHTLQKHQWVQKAEFGSMHFCFPA